jgi:hypothetical protein
MSVYIHKADKWLQGHPAWHHVLPVAPSAIDLGLQFVCAAGDRARGVCVVE